MIHLAGGGRHLHAVHRGYQGAVHGDTARSASRSEGDIAAGFGSFEIGVDIAGDAAAAGIALSGQHADGVAGGYSTAQGHIPVRLDEYFIERLELAAGKLDIRTRRNRDQAGVPGTTVVHLETAPENGDRIHGRNGDLLGDHQLGESRQGVVAAACRCQTLDGYIAAGTDIQRAVLHLEAAADGDVAARSDGEGAAGVDGVRLEGAVGLRITLVHDAPGGEHRLLLDNRFCLPPGDVAVRHHLDLGLVGLVPGPLAVHVRGGAGPLVLERQPLVIDGVPGGFPVEGVVALCLVNRIRDPFLIGPPLVVLPPREAGAPGLVPVLDLSHAAAVTGGLVFPDAPRTPATSPPAARSRSIRIKAAPVTAGITADFNVSEGGCQILVAQISGGAYVALGGPDVAKQDVVYVCIIGGVAAPERNVLVGVLAAVGTAVKDGELPDPVTVVGHVPAGRAVIKVIDLHTVLDIDFQGRAVLLVVDRGGVPPHTNILLGNGGFTLGDHPQHILLGSNGHTDVLVVPPGDVYVVDGVTARFPGADTLPHRALVQIRHIHHQVLNLGLPGVRAAVVGNAAGYISFVNQGLFERSGGPFPEILPRGPGTAAQHGPL